MEKRTTVTLSEEVWMILMEQKGALARVQKRSVSMSEVINLYVEEALKSQGYDIKTGEAEG